MKNIRKKPISKAKSDKPPRYSFSREEQRNRSDEERRRLFDRRSPKSKLLKAKQRIKVQFSNCKLYSLLSLETLKQENFQAPSNVSYIYINNNITTQDRYTTKRIVTSSEIEAPTLWGNDPETGYQLLEKERKTKISRLRYFQNRRKFMEHVFENDSQPKYRDQNSQQGERQSRISTVPAQHIPDLTNVLVNRSLNLYSEFKEGKRSPYYIRKNLEIAKRDFPQSEANFRVWMISPEGREFMRDIFGIT